jgi:3-deoxy-manno-octulosonate cytidylyltransferase (CMP-KDO synthetase)
MIQRVYEQATKSKKLSKIVVATDDKRIFDNVTSFGGQVFMTGSHHQNGTTRCNEVISILKNKGENFDIVINVQGDEPYINPKQIDNTISLFDDDAVQIGTLAKKITSTTELHDPNVVKVILNNKNQALYFSRHAIPMLRGVDSKDWLNFFTYYKHVGIYGYKTNILKLISTMAKGKLEQAEKLEQLRWLENNISVSVNITEFESVAIDTENDLLKLETYC